MYDISFVISSDNLVELINGISENHFFSLKFNSINFIVLIFGLYCNKF